MKHRVLLGALAVAATAFLLMVGRRPVAADIEWTAIAGRPLLFTETDGHFRSTAPDYDLDLRPGAAAITLHGDNGRSTMWSLRWIGAAPAPEVTGEQPHGTRYARVRYAAIYPGIDVVFYANPQRFEYDLVVAPGADPAPARLRFEGVDRQQLDAQTGDLLLRVGDRVVRHHRPVAYQYRAGARLGVPAAYVIGLDRTITFSLGTWDREAPLVIDPVVETRPSEEREP